MNNTTTTLWFDWDDTSRGCQAQTRAPYVAPLRAPTCDPLTHAWAQLQEQYLDRTAAFLDGPFEAARVEAKLAAWELQIAPVVEEAAALHRHGHAADDGGRHGRRQWRGPRRSGQLSFAVRIAHNGFSPRFRPTRARRDEPCSGRGQ